MSSSLCQASAVVAFFLVRLFLWMMGLPQSWVSDHKLVGAGKHPSFVRSGCLGHTIAVSLFIWIFCHRISQALSSLPPWGRRWCTRAAGGPSLGPSLGRRAPGRRSLHPRPVHCGVCKWQGGLFLLCRTGALVLAFAVLSGAALRQYYDVTDRVLERVGDAPATVPEEFFDPVADW